MYTQVKNTPKPTAPVFIIAGEHEPSRKFVAGRCVCKVCRSTDMAYYAYLDDAKCSICMTWQNEDPIID